MNMHATQGFCRNCPARDKAKICNPNNTSTGINSLTTGFSAMQLKLFVLYTIILHESKFYPTYVNIKKSSGRMLLSLATCNCSVQRRIITVYFVAVNVLFNKETAVYEK